jgi:hypothetical protein
MKRATDHNLFLFLFSISHQVANGSCHGYEIDIACLEMAIIRVARSRTGHHFLDSELVPFRSAHSVGVLPHVAGILSHCRRYGLQSERPFALDPQSLHLCGSLSNFRAGMVAF